MRIILTVFSLLVLILVSVKCKENTSQNISTSEKKIQDSLKLVSLLSFNDVKSTALIIQNDTVFFLIPSHFDETKYEFVRNFFYDSSNNFFYFNYNANQNNYRGSINLQSFLNKSQVYLKSLLKTGISYSKSTDKLKDNVQLKKILRTDTKIQPYGSIYYIINTESPKAISGYDTLNNELKTYSFNTVIMDVTDFFLYDIDKDGNPEIFILHTGLIPRDEIISYSIYSLRKDSAKVYSK